MIALRPHHGLCMAFFQGKGYSEGFVENMTAVKAALEAGERVKLVCGPDRVCAACPNRRGELCRTEEKVCRYDEAVLERCGLEPGQSLRYPELAAAVEEKIIAAGDRERVCGDCQWSALCR